MSVRRPATERVKVEGSVGCSYGVLLNCRTFWYCTLRCGSCNGLCVCVCACVRACVCVEQLRKLFTTASRFKECLITAN